MASEATLTRKVLAYLKPLEQSGAAWVLKIHGGPAQKAGVPDVLVIYQGRHFLMELKGDDGELSKLQSIQIGKIRRAGGKAYVVDSFERFLEIMKGENCE